MASSILSDNGVSSGSAGIKTTADSTGSLALQTTTAGGVATTAVTIDTSQNVGIGTATPRTSKLDVMSATGTQNTSGDGSGLVNITGPNSPNGSQPIFVIATNDAMAANIGPAITFQARYLTSSTAAATLGYIQCIKENATSNNLQGALAFVPRNSAGNFVEAGRFDSSGNLQFNSGYGSVATAYGCRAWVNFNGTGTVAIRASGNVSSITDNGTGDYTVNFTTSMPDANYSAIMLVNHTLGGNFGGGIEKNGGVRTASAIQLISVIINGSFNSQGNDESFINVSIFR